MSMTIEQMRAEVAALYTGPKWKEKVAGMHDKQILAIYNRQVLGATTRKGGGVK